MTGNREDEEMKGRREEDAGAKAKMKGGKKERRKNGSHQCDTFHFGLAPENSAHSPPVSGDCLLIYTSAVPSFFLLQMLPSQPHVPETDLQLGGPDEDLDKLLHSTGRNAPRVFFQQLYQKVRPANQKT